MSWRNVVLPALVILAAFLCAALLYASRPVLDPQATEPVPTAVRVLPVLPGQVTLTVASQGSVTPRTESDLVPEVSGRVTWLSPDLVPGGYFEAGEPLLRLDPADYENQLARARAALERARAEAEHARFEFERLDSLRSRDLASASQTENARRAARVAAANLMDAEASLAQAQRDLARTTITAPFPGLVRSKLVDVGQFVARGTPAARIYATDRVEVRLPVADEQLAFLDVPLGHRGQLPDGSAPAVRLHAEFAGRRLEWQGRIRRLEAEIDSKSRMVLLVAEVENARTGTPLTVGQFVNAEIEGRRVDDVVALPRAALRNGDQVLVVDAENRLRFRDVSILRLQDDDVLIRGGLAPGERVCISPLATVIDGMAVAPEPIEGTAAAPAPAGARAPSTPAAGR
jgi:RND family efflux transporter MFP subunit